MKTLPLMIGSVVTLCLATVSPAQQAEPHTDSDQEIFVYVVVKDRSIMEDLGRVADRANFEALVRPAMKLSQLSGGTTQEVDCSRGCTAEKLADSFFDLYAESWSNSSALTSQWIQVSNDLPTTDSAAELVLPTMPIKANEDFRETGVRIYEPNTEGEGPIYYQGSTLSDLRRLSLSVEPIQANDPRRNANFTIIKLTREEYESSYSLMGENAFLTAYVGPGNVQEAGLSTITIILASEEEFTAPTGSFLQHSPIRDRWTAWLMSKASLDGESLRKKAAEQPLVLIDWDFVQGHGKRVAAVVSAASQAFGVGELPVEVLDLHPRRDPENLRRLIAEYCQSFGERECKAGFPPVLRNKSESLTQVAYWNAGSWIDSHDPPDDGNLKIEIDQFVLKAAMWKYLRKGTIVNLSFSMLEEQAAPVSQYFRDRQSLIFAAAGNDYGPLSPRFYPQALARSFPAKIVNVTFGGADGRVLGSYSSRDPASMSDVTLVAQGDAFEHWPSQMDGTGSSFAAPLVATAAWVRSLLTDTVVDYKSLMRSSRPFPDSREKVVSGGFFDPYLLLAGPGTFMIQPTGCLVMLRSGRIEFTYQKNGSEEPGSFVIGSGEGGAIRFYASPEGPRVYRVMYDEAGSSIDFPVRSVRGYLEKDPSGEIVVVDREVAVAGLEVIDATR